MQQNDSYAPNADKLRSVEKFKMIPGRTLVIGPSRAGKSFFAEALKTAGLNVIDADKDTDLMKWRSDITGETVIKPLHTDDTWLANNHFTIKPNELREFLDRQGDVIVFAHCWNIMDVLGEFDHAAYMELPAQELERRLQVERSDHTGVGSTSELEFFRQRHLERSHQAKERSIPFVDATLKPAQFYDQLSTALHSGTKY